MACMVFAGTTVSSGSGHFIVSAIGMKTGSDKLRARRKTLAQERVPFRKRIRSFDHHRICKSAMVAATLFVHRRLCLKKPLFLHWG